MNDKIDKFLSTLDRSLNTIETYRWALYQYIEAAGSEFNNDAYEYFLETLKYYSPSTKLVMRSAVMKFYDFCDIPGKEAREKLNEHYTGKVKPSPVNFKRDAIEKVISYCDTLTEDLMGFRDRAFVLNLADSGFRISELVSLKRGDIDWLDQRASIVGKGNKPALVRLSNRGTEALRQYFSVRMDGTFGKPLNSLPLFAQHGKTKELKAMTIDGMRKAVKERIVQSGVNREDVRIHDFRHYFVTVTLLSSNNLKTAQELARHESTATTQRYAHLTNSELDAEYDKIFNKKGDKK